MYWKEKKDFPEGELIFMMDVADEYQYEQQVETAPIKPQSKSSRFHVAVSSDTLKKTADVAILFFVAFGKFVDNVSLRAETIFTLMLKKIKSISTDGAKRIKRKAESVRDRVFKKSIPDSGKYEVYLPPHWVERDLAIEGGGERGFV